MSPPSTFTLMKPVSISNRGDWKTPLCLFDSKCV